MLASSSTTSTRGRVAPLAWRTGAVAAGAGGAPPPRGRWLSSQASMSRLRNRHWRPTRTAGILPALISRYTVRRLTWRYSRTSSVVRNVSSIMRQRPGDGAIGNSTVNTAPPSAMIGGDDLAAMLLHDAVRDGQAEAGAFADFLGRVERLENARQRVLGNADAGIANRRDNPVAGAAPPTS